jgi:hypothetical protein
MGWIARPATTIADISWTISNQNALAHEDAALPNHALSKMPL